MVKHIVNFDEHLSYNNTARIYNEKLNLLLLLPKSYPTKMNYNSLSTTREF